MPSYIRPPVVETVFEIYYSSPRWSGALPGLVYQSLRKEFPIIREKPDGFQFGGFGMPTLTPVSGTTQFVTERNDKLIQLSSSIFTANVVQDYKGWEEFFPVIESALNIFLQNVEEPAIARAGLR